jgi:general secretion pathway protein A
MYNTHYNFEKKPFEITPDPEFIWLSEAHKQAIDPFKQAAQKNEGILVVTGDVGTGKTIFINYLIKELADHLACAQIPFPDLDSLSFFQYLSEEIGLNHEISSKGSFLVYLDQYLRKISDTNSGVMIVIDDAQNLSHDIANEVRFLSLITVNEKKMIRILLVAQSTGDKDFSKYIETEVGQKVSFIYSTKALTRSETSNYIDHRLKKAGAQKTLIAPDGIDEIYSYSAGNQREINIVCDHALLIGYSEGLAEINKSTIIDCIQDLRERGV